MEIKTVHLVYYSATGNTQTVARAIGEALAQGLNAALCEVDFTLPAARQAVQTFMASQPGQFDLILMDVMMPVMNGLEATRHIRAMSRPDARTVPIFAMTANTFAADRKKCYDAGMSGYIPKPIDLETITHVLEEETGE